MINYAQKYKMKTNYPNVFLSNKTQKQKDIQQ